jgi:hypothetical protein
MSVRNTILANLKTALDDIVGDGSYDLTIQSVTRQIENVGQLGRHLFPLVMIWDRDEEEKVAEDSSHIRYHLPVQLIGVVKAETEDDLLSDANNLVATLKSFVEAGPSLGDNVLDVQWTMLDGLEYYQGSVMAQVVCTLRVVYYTEIGTF